MVLVKQFFGITEEDLKPANALMESAEEWGIPLRSPGTSA
jgi:hypothetical protein